MTIISYQGQNKHLNSKKINKFNHNIIYTSTSLQPEPSVSPKNCIIKLCCISLRVSYSAKFTLPVSFFINTMHFYILLLNWTSQNWQKSTPCFFCISTFPLPCDVIRGSDWYLPEARCLISLLYHLAVSCPLPSICAAPKSITFSKRLKLWRML